MTQPTPYQRQFNFTGWSSSSPNRPQPGVSLDADFNAIRLTLSQVLTNLALIQRDDTRLANGSVGVDQLDGTALAIIGQGGFTVRGNWTPITPYNRGDVVSNDGQVYLVTTSHTSNAILVVDLASELLVTIFNPNAIPQPGTATLADGDYGDIDATLAGTQLTVSPNAITNAKLVGVNTGTLKGRVSSGFGPVEDLTGTDVTALLASFTEFTRGIVPASGGGVLNFLRADGSWSQPDVASLSAPGYMSVADKTKLNGITAGAVDAAGARAAVYTGGTMTGPLILAGDATTALGAATKQQVDSIAAGFLNKFSVAAATTANITLSGEQTIDGVLTSGSRVLVKNQTLPAQNGIYVTAAGAWTRATDMDTWGEAYGAGVFVTGGTTLASTGWSGTSITGGTIGTTPITFIQQSASITYSASTGLVLGGNAFALTGQALSLHNLAGSGVFTRAGGGAVSLTATGVAAAGSILTRADGDARFQGLSTTLTAVAGVALAADQLTYGSGVGTVATTALTAFGRSILGQVDDLAVRSLIGANISANVGYSPDVTLGQATDVDNKLNQHRTILDFIPSSLHGAIINGTNTADLTAYVQRALNAGGVLDTLRYTYLTLGLTAATAGTRLVGSGRFLLLPAAASGTVHLQIGVSGIPISDITIEKDVVFDGSTITTAGVWVYGIRNSAQITDCKILCRVENYSFTGVEIHSNGGAWTNSRIWLGAVVTNVGWAGIVAHGITSLDFTNSRVRRVGYHGYDIQGCSHVYGSLRADRSVAPYRTFNGAGFTSIAFCVARFNNTDEAYPGCDCIGNGAGDIWGLSEGGSDVPNSCRRTYVSGVFTDTAASTGFDVTSDMVADVVLNGPNCFLGLDYGGIIENVEVRAVVNTPANDAACRLAPTIEIARTITTTNGSPTITVTGDPTLSGGYLINGVIITGSGIPVGTKIIAVAGNTLTMDTNATASATGVSATFRGPLIWRNVNVTVVVSNANYALAIWDALDASYGSFTNVNIKIVARNIALADIISYPIDTLPPGVKVEFISGEPKPVTIVSNAYSVVGRTDFTVSGGGTLNRMLDGYAGQEVTCYASGANFTLDFDWPDAGGFGQHRLLGASNIDFVVKNGGCFKATRRHSGGWYVHTVMNPYP